jgi:hypothetical protein
MNLLYAHVIPLLKKKLVFAYCCREIVKSDLVLQPVVLPVESNAFLIEIPEFCSDPELSLLYIPDHYKEIFAPYDSFLIPVVCCY